MNNKNNNEYNIIDLKEYLTVIKKRKFWFLGIFLIVLVLSAFTFFYINKDSQYSAQSQISISEFNKSYQEIISESYPDDASKLWLVSAEKQLIPRYFEEIIINIRNDEILSKVSDALQNRYSVEELKDQVKAESVINENKLIVTTYFDTPEEARLINNTIVAKYNEQKQADFNNSYEILVSKIESRLSELDKEYKEASNEAEQYILDLNEKLIESVVKSGNESIEFKGLDYLSPAIENRLTSAEEEITLLTDILDNLKKNKDVFIERMIINELPDIEKNTNIFSTIIISLAIAIFSSFILGNFINSIINLRARNK